MFNNNVKIYKDYKESWKDNDVTHFKTSVCNRTGEILNEKITTSSGFFNDDGYLFRPNSKGYKRMINKPLPSQLTYTDKGRLMDLMCYLYKEDNILARVEGYKRMPVPLTDEMICNVFNLSDRKGKELLRKLVNLDILAKTIPNTKYGTKPYYCVNPIYFWAGKRLSLGLYLAFRHVLKDELPPKAIDVFESM